MLQRLVFINVGVLFICFYLTGAVQPALLLIADQAAFAGAASYFRPHFLAWFVVRFVAKFVAQSWW